MAHRHRLLAYARQQVDGMTDAEMLLLDTARRVTEAYCLGRVPLSDLMPYTLRSLYTAAIDMRYRNARRLEAERRYGHEACKADTPPQGAAAAELSDTHLALRQAVRRLPEELNLILTLRIWGEHTFPDIATMLRLSESTVRRRYETALEQLKPQINHESHEQQ